MVIDGDILTSFIRESNEIEGIHRHALQTEIDIHEKLLGLDEITISDLMEFVWTVQPGANLRNRLDMNVWIGNHTPPPGGPEVQEMLDGLLQRILLRDISPWEAHAIYETIHPFMDGNGRSGRALWLWQSIRDGEFVPGRSFLQHWYYSTLDRFRLPKRI